MYANASVRDVAAAVRSLKALHLFVEAAMPMGGKVRSPGEGVCAAGSNGGGFLSDGWGPRLPRSRAGSASGTHNVITNLTIMVVSAL